MILRVVVSALVVLLAAPAALAHQAEQFATSPRTMGFAGAGEALGDGAGSTYGMPAALGLARTDQFRINWIGGVVTLAEVVGVQRIDAEGEVIPADQLSADLRLPEQALPQNGVTIDLMKRLGPWVTAGAYVTFPIPYLYFHDSQDAWSPNTIRWRNRSAQATGFVGGSVRLPVRGLPSHVGEESALQGGLWVGVSLGILPKANIEIDLDLIGVGEEVAPFVDVALRDVDLVVKARFRPVFSALLDMGTFVKPWEGTRIGLTFRPETQVDIDPIHLNVAVEGLGNLATIFTLVNRIEAEVWLGLVDFYEPNQLKGSFAVQRPRWSLAVDVMWSQWSKLVASYGRVVEGDDGTGGSLILDLAGDNDFLYTVLGRRVIDEDAFRDTVDVAFGAELVPLVVPTWPGKPPFTLAVRAGYRYQPPIVRPTDGPSALLDGGAHTIGVGLGLTAPSLPLFRDGPFLLDWGLQVQRLEGMALPKSEAALAGISGMPVVYSDGANWPGGWAVVTGLQVGTGF